MTRLLVAAALATFSSVATAQSGGTAQSVAVTLSEWKVRVARDTVPAGSVTFRVTNNGAVTHQFHVQGEGIEKETQPIAAHQSAELTMTLKPGTYEVYCPMSDLSHKNAGMLKKLIVTGGDAAAPKKPDA